METNNSRDNRNIKPLFVGTLFHNILIVALCLAGMGVSFWFFWQDLNQTLQQMEEEPIGTVYWIDNTVQRLSVRRLQWERVERYSAIYNGDTIKCAALSTAKIHFINGESLELSENSSVHITYQKNKIPHIELYNGAIQVQSNRSEIIVTVQESGGKASGDSVPAAGLNPKTSAGIKASNGCTLKIYQGSGSLSSHEATRRVSEGKTLKLGAGGEFLPDPPIMVLSPRNGTRLIRTSRGNAPVKFLWQKTASQENSGVWLEIAETSSFTTLVGSWYSEKNDSMEVELAEGTYYWKIYIDPVLEEVDSGRIEIIYSRGPRAISPPDGSIQTFEHGSQELRFYWSAPEETEAVLLEVASNRDMTRPRLRHLIKMANAGSDSYVSSEIGPGQWYWRIHPVFPGGVSESDNTSSLSASGQNFWRMRPVNADIIADALPSEVNSFILEEKTGLNIPAVPGSTPRQNAGPGSTPRLIYPPDNFTLETNRTPDLFFSWNNPASYNARIQISERSDFSGVLVMDENVFGSNIQSPFLKPGTYYWHITNAGNTNTTVPARLVITPALEAPSLTSPRENERLLIEEGKPVIFSWERREYANYYRFSLFLEGRDIPLTEISSLQNNSVLVFFDTGTAGRFRWTVQGFSTPSDTSSGRNGLIAQGSFTIAPPAGAAMDSQVNWRLPRIANIQSYSGEVRSPITLTYPPSGINIPGILALRTPPEARWTSSEPLRNVQLIVSRTSDPSSDPKATILDAGTSSVNFPLLAEGIWYWLIRGDTSAGRGATSGDPFWFNILPIPLLPAPKTLQPENSSTIDIVQLTRDRSITFRWDETEGANAYIFNLFLDGDPPISVILTPPEAILSYTLDNLSLIKQGNYLWQVESVYLNRNGDIDQRGVIEKHGFAIDIQRSSSLQTHGLGTMYGQ